MPELVCAADDPRWLDERRRGVTATDIPVILGLTTWNSPHGLWWDKTRPDQPEHVDNDRFRLGRELEPYIVERWVETLPKRPAVLLDSNKLWRSDDRPWQLATPDEVISWGTWQETLEVKSWADADRHAWDDGPPPAVRAQALWQADVMNVTSAHVGVMFLPSGEFRSYEIEHDGHAMIAVAGVILEKDCSVCIDIEAMRAEGEKFYRRMLGELPPPDVDGSAATLAALRARFTPAEGPAADIDPVAWHGLTRARAKKAEGEADAAYFDALIRKEAGTATRYKVAGQVVGRRITADAQVKAHTRHQDYIRILASKDDDDADA